LYEDFTNDLLDTSKTLFHELPLDSWNPQEVAAPERHLSLRKDPLPQCVALLDQLNPAFARIEHMMRIYFSPTTSLSLDAEKEQVWLFGYSWFSAYYDMLMEGSVLHTEFYRTYHDLLFDLLRKCLQVDPVDRPTFASLMKAWPGTAALLSKAEVPIASDSPSPCLPPPLVTPPQSSSKRLVLLGHGGRKKTRRNLRS